MDNEQKYLFNRFQRDIIARKRFYRIAKNLGIVHLYALVLHFYRRIHW